MKHTDRMFSMQKSETGARTGVEAFEQRRLDAPKTNAEARRMVTRATVDILLIKERGITFGIGPSPKKRT